MFSWEHHTTWVNTNRMPFTMILAAAQCEAGGALQINLRQAELPTPLLSAGFRVNGIIPANTSGSYCPPEENSRALSERLQRAHQDLSTRKIQSPPRRSAKKSVAPTRAAAISGSPAE